MSGQKQIAVNFIIFQLGWFSCVLMAARGFPEIGIMITLLLVAVQLFLAENRKNLLILLFLITLIGSAWDSVLTSLNILMFNTGMMVSYLAPGWIIAMWLIFSTTLNVSFHWLYGRYWLAMLLGMIFGPLAYQAGAALGAVEIPDILRANVSMAIGWSLLMPLSIKLAEIFDSEKSVGGEL